MLRKTISFTFAAFPVAVFAFFILALVLVAYFNIKNFQLTEDKIFVIEANDTFNGVVRKLHQEQIVKNPLTFEISSKLLRGHNPKIFKGEYIFPIGISNYEILDKITSGKTYSRKITVAEGLSTHSILKLIDSAPGLTGEIKNRNDIKEGALLPETYFYSRGDDKNKIIAKMQEDMQRNLDELWEKRDPTIPVKTKEQALILASIVEKETGVDYERPVVASVFINRLKKRMKLQSDPTIIYSFAFGNTDLERTIRKSDITNKSRFNTYNIYGLPPTPICNPGLDSIKAVLNPIKTNYLYFVATGDGKHNFSSTLVEHNQYVAQYRRVLREYRQRRNQDVVPIAEENSLSIQQ